MSILSGSLDLNGNIAISENISFTTSGSGVIQTLTTIAANGTASYAGFSDTTASLNFGINLINYATSQNYCVKLPQPTTGKSVTVVNKSGIDIKVFPSNIGGDINGQVNGFATIPSNGTSYLFNCYENPLPGGWSILSTSGTNQTIISEAISGSLGLWLSSTGSFIFVNNTIKASGSGFASFPPQTNFLVISPTDPQYQATNNTYFYDLQPNPYLVTRQFPTDSWRRINSITLATNITGSTAITNRIVWQLFVSQQRHYYSANNPALNFPEAFWNVNTGYPNIDPAFSNYFYNVYTPWAAANDGNGVSVSGVTNGPVAASVTFTPGTFTADNISPYLAVNAGDPGTATFTINFPQQYIANSIGHTDLGARYIGSFTPSGYYYNGTSYVPFGPINAYNVKCWGIGMFNLSSTVALPDFKIIPQYNITLN
jgi:hypothetical protein